MKGKRVISPLSLVLKVISSKLFLEIVLSTPAYNVTTSVAPMFSWRMKLRVSRVIKSLGLSD